LQDFEEDVRVRLLGKLWILEICPQTADETYIILRLSLDHRGEKSFELAMLCENPAVRAKENKLNVMNVELQLFEEGQSEAATVVSILHPTQGLRLLV